MDTEKTVDTEVVAEATEEVKEVVAEAAEEVKEAPAATDGDQRAYTQRQPRQNFRKRRKVCEFCVNGIDEIDYKDAGKLRKYTSERAKILPRRVTGACAKHQRQITIAVKRARQVALLPYISD